MHAREWITAKLVLEQIRRGVRGGVWFIPLVNPDGALLSQCGISSVEGRRRREMLVRINGGFDFSLWKANADGVDINVNFDANWGKGKGNLTDPAPQGYIGPCAFSSEEAQALKSFTLAVRPDFTVSYHTKGEVIYWRFGQNALRCLRDRRLARILQRSTGYPLGEAPCSAGGYKDWCIQKLRIPAFTVEVGSDRLAHPLGESALKDIVSRNGDSIRKLTEGF